MSLPEKSVPLTYFTTTLGQVAQRPPTGFSTVNQLIYHQAQKHSDRPACGFASPKEGSEWGCEVFTFNDLYLRSMAIVEAFGSVLSHNSNQNQRPCVALLCPSSVDFLFTWLGLMRAGASVLLIAPQCQPEAIAHLCKSCNADLLVYDEAYSNLASLSKTHTEDLRIAQIPWQTGAIKLEMILSSAFHTAKFPTVDENDIAYIHHTSGTSSGLPKPIPQTQRGGVGVLPSLDGANAATFTTTPLYHGGVADCFRAWTSGAMIWLFPGDRCPITTKNILSCIEVAEKEVKLRFIPRVEYFSSVPYVLQMLAEDDAGLQVLQKMDIVGVGGAALPPIVGESLVHKGVRLVSRFGSAECGFLLSSDRAFEADKDWQYLRVPRQSDHLLRFEQHSSHETLFELIVLPQWPHMAKRNRPDGSFATSDLFQRHPAIPNAWKYHSRCDSQITLLTGKKFDPAPIEDEIASKSQFIREVLVLGDGKQVPGALIFSTSTEASLEDDIWSIVLSVNEKGQNHTRISKERIKILDSDVPLGRSSKGTLLRAAANERFAREIHEVYIEEEDSKEVVSIDDQEVKNFVRTTVHKYLEKNLADDADLYKCGVDSASCTQIRSILKMRLLPYAQPLPWNVVYDCGSIERLSQYILDVRRGKERKSDAESQDMLDLVDRYSDFGKKSTLKFGIVQDAKPAVKAVLLTGATGALGAHLLDSLRQDSSITSIICLVRASDQKNAQMRVSNSLRKRRKDPALGDVECLPAQLGKQNLGLDDDKFHMLRSQVTHIIHAAWTVNFSLPLRSFEDDNIAGLYNLIFVARSCRYPAKLLFCSSTASVLGKDRSSPIPETISSDPSDSDRLGYSQSKWVAERICFSVSKSEDMRGRIKVLRIGQLTGDTLNGVWNMTEAWPLMLSTVESVGCLPRRDDILSWLPLDVAARAILEICMEETKPDISSDGFPVFHILNNSTATSWSDLLGWIKEVRSTAFDIVESSVWAKKVENIDSHPAKNLLWLWSEGRQEHKESGGTQISFEVMKAKESSKAMRSVKPVEKELVQKIWKWIESELSQDSNG